jgi:hypothetical protein
MLYPALNSALVRPYSPPTTTPAAGASHSLQPRSVNTWPATAAARPSWVRAKAQASSRGPGPPGWARGVCCEGGRGGGGGWEGRGEPLIARLYVHSTQQTMMKGWKGVRSSGDNHLFHATHNCAKSRHIADKPHPPCPPQQPLASPASALGRHTREAPTAATGRAPVTPAAAGSPAACQALAAAAALAAPGAPPVRLLLARGWRGHTPCT